MMLAPYLQMVVWLCKFHPTYRRSTTGRSTPREFLQIYSTSILAAGGDEAVMANYFSVALTGMTRS
jgi:hypothetical protein